MENKEYELSTITISAQFRDIYELLNEQRVMNLFVFSFT